MESPFRQFCEEMYCGNADGNKVGIGGKISKAASATSASITKIPFLGVVAAKVIHVSLFSSQLFSFRVSSFHVLHRLSARHKLHKDCTHRKG